MGKNTTTAITYANFLCESNLCVRFWMGTLIIKQLQLQAMIKSQRRELKFQANIEDVTMETQRTKVIYVKLVLLLNIGFYWVKPHDMNLKVASFTGFMGQIYVLN